MNLSSLDEDVQYYVSPKTGCKTYLIHMKLTESCAKALESVQKKSHLSIWFTEDGGGYMTAPCENGDVQKFQLVSGGSVSDKASLDCLIQKSEAERTVIQTMGSLDHKVTIKATDEVYETTKLRATQLEKERKEARAKEINVATTSKIKSSNHKSSRLESHRSNLHDSHRSTTDSHRSNFDGHRTNLDTHRTHEAHRTNVDTHRTHEAHRTNLDTLKPKTSVSRNPTPPVMIQETTSASSAGSTITSEEHRSMRHTTPTLSESQLRPVDHTSTEHDKHHRSAKSKHHAIVTTTKDRQPSPAIVGEKVEKPNNASLSDSKENLSFYNRDFPPLTDAKQRSEYKLIFNEQYKLYLSLKQAFDEIQHEVNDLSKQFKSCEDKRKAKIIKRRIKQKYFEIQHDSSYRDRRQQLLHLHSKLDHIKRMITEYDEAQ